MKQRHSSFVHLGRHLKEVVRYYGEFTNNDSKIKYFWHGVDCKLLFDSVSAVFKSPTSTSSVREVCLNFTKNDGLLVKMHCGYNEYVGRNPRYFDFSWISDYGAEFEKFFIAQHNAAPLNFETIIFTKTNDDYLYYMKAIKIIVSIIEPFNFDQSGIPKLFIKKQKEIDCKKLAFRLYY